ncbi:protein kinase [Aspergillus steynii IBT 23096]|uniref:non-specific serine/threonine protein kinase n=1 Tax=Aspergillus steynii IBT 23096 TaxID=1392250 RepID=A0A2I2G5E9_9EURO|nr:protein kinase [Aspergillus steynii IBT 23096]PLB48108.1 protein kinase [Aspergillus steynii IBT 23096]
MNAIKPTLTKARSQISKLLGSPSQLASLERLTPLRVTEEPDYYNSGGFHPITLGDTFNSDQYTILRKLGYGQYSTVWLARDSRYQRFVALKILRADCYGGPHDIFEREILSRISEVSAKSTHEGRNYVSGLLDHFKHTGPNGDHVCFVFDVLGHHMDFQAAKYEDGKLPVKAVKVIVRQLLLGLDFLHRECGIVHTDLKPTNILLELENQKDAVSQYLAKVPRRTGTKDGGTVPLREVITTPLIGEMEKPHIRIIDFGVASWRENHLSEMIQSSALRAPEVTIGAPWDVGVDIWSLGCLVVEFAQGIVLFSGEASRNGSWTAEDDHLARISEVLGPFPLQFLEKGNRTAHFFDKNGNLIRIPDLKPTSLERLVNGATKPFLKPSDMPQVEVPIFVDFLRGMLEIDPGSRKSASELLQHEWLNPRNG